MATKLIDFSSKHDVLLRNPDGTFTPMDEPWYQAELIAPDTWKILSSGDHHYLVAGDEACISIDNGYGAGNVREYCESLAGKPCPWTANTHDHFDHTANNSYFDMVFMAEAGVPRACVPYASFEGIDFPRDYPVTILKNGDFIPLKGRELQAFLIPDHDFGSMMYLDRKERILFSGDEIMGLRKNLNYGLKSWIENLEYINQYRSEFDVLYAGLGRQDGDYFDKALAVARYAWDHEGTVPAPRGGMGGPGGPGGHKPPWMNFEVPEEYKGRTIYDRKMPHPGDSAANAPSPDPRPRSNPEDMRLVEYNGAAIVYDITRKFE